MVQLKTLPNFYFSVSNKLSGIVKKQGQVIISKDDQKLFIDIDSSKRIDISDLVHISSASMLPLSALDKVYIDDENKDLYLYIGDDWVRYTCQDNTTIKVQKDNIIYQPNIIECGNGIYVEEDETTGNITLSVALSHVTLPFSATDLNAESFLKVTNATVGSFSVIDGNGSIVYPNIIQDGPDAYIDFRDWNVTGVWKLVFPNGSATSADSVNDIVAKINEVTHVSVDGTNSVIDAEQNTVYEHANILNSLMIDSVEPGYKPIDIVFTPNIGFTFNYNITRTNGIVRIEGEVPIRFIYGKVYTVHIVDQVMKIVEGESSTRKVFEVEEPEDANDATLIIEYSTRSDFSDSVQMVDTSINATGPLPESSLLCSILKNGSRYNIQINLTSRSIYFRYRWITNDFVGLDWVLV